MKQSFRFGYAAGQEVVNRLSHMTKQEASQKIPSVILSVLTFILGFLLAEHMATFGWYMVFDMLKGWAIICSLWFFTSLIILLLRLKGTAVKRNLIIRYAGKNMGLYSVASIAVFSAVAAILGRIYHGDSSSMVVWVLPIFPITLPIWLNRRFRFVLGPGTRVVEEQYCAYQHERMERFLARAKENVELDSFTPQIFEGYVRYDLAKEAASAAACGRHRSLSDTVFDGLREPNQGEQLTCLGGRSCVFIWVAGMGDGTFAPNSKLTFAQFYAMVTSIFRADALAEYQPDPGSAWWQKYMWVGGKYLQANTIWMDTQPNVGRGMTLQESIERHADEAITRTDAISILWRVLGEWRANEEVPGVDAARETILADGVELNLMEWDTVPVCYAAGLISGDERGELNLKGTLTRAEGCVMLCNLVDYAASHGITMSGSGN